MKRNPNRNVSGYRSWKAMKQRCLNPRATDYSRYGGRGIKVCPQWLISFTNFLADMGPRPSPQHSLDRIDSEGDYEPGNCRWADWTTQQNNKEIGVLQVEYDGSIMTLAEAIRADGSKIKYGTVQRRFSRGWPLLRAIRAPERKNPRWHGGASV